MQLIKKLFGNYSDKEIKRIIPTVNKIDALEPEMEKLSDEQLRAKTDEFKQRFENGETLDDLLIEAYAVVREASRRVLNMRHFRVQMIGGIVLHQGRIAEMRTGEGKTLVATLPSYLNALSGKGVTVVTVNDYLAKRDSEWMGQIHEFLGLSVGVILHDMKPEERREAYASDITYATNNELGFDYLRDNMVVFEKDLVQRELNYAIIDEIDSILIDEARTPLIISGSSGKSTQLYKVADSFVKRLKKGKILNEDEALSPLLKAELQEEGDFVVDEKAKTVSLTAEGVKKAEAFFSIGNLADPENMEIQHHVNNALKANYNMHLDKDYVNKDNEIVIIDEFTGRMMPGRRYSDGLHQAIEAKEGVEVNRESKTLATITFQNFFNKYAKKSGMTGTALTEEGEFRHIYGLDVVVVPTNKDMVRDDRHDIVYKTEEAKFKAVCDEVEQAHAKGQPVLVGTVSIDKSEILSDMLRRRGVKHEVLNAKHHEREADIVSLAGQKGAVTIATNMAGRGTDIKLEDGVTEIGGLKIIGTERHESRRIDNQLRGRAGRQGDPGESRFYISLEDDLMRLFGSDRMKTVVDAMGLKDDEPIEHNMLSRTIEGAQKKVEGNHFSVRKHLLEYDRINNEQREIIYKERRKVLEGADMQENIQNMMHEIINRAVDTYTSEGEDVGAWDTAGFVENVAQTFDAPKHSVAGILEGESSKDALKEKTYALAKKLYDAKEEELTPERMREIERVIMLRVIDQKWMDHIDDMDQMRQGISLRAYAQRDPLLEYKFISYDMFEELSQNIQTDTIKALFRVRVAVQPERQRVAKEMFTNKDESATKAPIKRKEAKVGRNDPCSCGSGQKYKHCCGRA